MTSQMRLTFLFSAVFLLAVARAGVAGENTPSPLMLNTESFEDFVEFESGARLDATMKVARGCSARSGPTVAAPIKHIVSVLPSGLRVEVPDEQANNTIVISGAGYNYQREH